MGVLSMVLKKMASFKVFIALRDFFRNSSIHGLKFIFNENHHWTERVFWLVTITVSWYGCVELAKASWDDFINNPMSFAADTNYLEWDTRFPAIIICEVDNSDRIAKITDKMYGDPHDYNIDEVIKELTYFRGMSYYTLQLCVGPEKNVLCPSNNFSYIANVVRSNCIETFQKCKWNNEEFDCCRYFVPMDTELGVCYAINSIQTRYLTKGRTFQLISNMKTGPGALIVEIKIPANIYIMGEDEVPSLTTPPTDTFTVAPKTLHRRYMTIKEIDNEEQVRNLNPGQRKCRYNNERDNIDVYKHYSYSTCCVQCRKDEQLRICNCTQHFMPNTDPKLQCDIDGLTCLNKYYKDWAVLKAPWSSTSGLNCDCMPSCKEIEVSIIKDDITGFPGSNAEVGFILNTLPTERSKRIVIRGQLDLIVSIGGTLGLFVGASLLSLAELIYFLTIRICYNIRK